MHYSETYAYPELHTRPHPDVYCVVRSTPTGDCVIPIHLTDSEFFPGTRLIRYQFLEEVGNHKLLSFS